MQQEIEKVRAAYGILAPAPSAEARRVKPSAAREAACGFVGCTVCYAIAPETAAGHQKK
jgi:hypothetical protein